MNFTTSKLLTQILQVLAIMYECMYNCQTFLVTVCVDCERFKPALLNTMKGHAEWPSLIWLRWFWRHFYSDVAVADFMIKYKNSFWKRMHHNGLLSLIGHYCYYCFLMEVLLVPKLSQQLFFFWDPRLQSGLICSKLNLSLKFGSELLFGNL